MHGAGDIFWRWPLQAAIKQNVPPGLTQHEVGPEGPVCQ